MKPYFMKIKSGATASGKWPVTGDEKSLPAFRHPSPVTRHVQRAFTLIELLVVISIMAILAAFTMGVVTQIKKVEYVNTASAELSQIQTALESYKNQYGSYPPSNPANSLTNTLYYELEGVTNYLKSGVSTYETLDGASTISAPAYSSASLFNVGGVINCMKSGDTESAKAQNFLPSLKQNRIGTITDANGNSVNLLVTSMRGPDVSYTPLGTSFPDLNPFRYIYPGTNNPSSYDLYVQLKYRGTTYLVCNWSKNAIKNSPLP